MEITPELRAFIVGVVEERLRELRLTRESFEKLREAMEENTKAIKSLAEAQRRTEEQLNTLAERVDALAEAQKRTEGRLNALAEAQMRTEKRVEELAEAQGRTEERLSILAEAQRRTEESLGTLARRVDSLADAQKRTEESVMKLSEAVALLRVEVGRLSEAVGFSLEDLARWLFPSRLREEGVEVEGFERRFFLIDGREVEINLYGEGCRDGEEVIILGEVKSRIYSDDVNRFAGIAERIEALMGRRAYKLFFGFAIHPSALRDAEERDVHLYTAYRP